MGMRVLHIFSRNFKSLIVTASSASTVDPSVDLSNVCLSYVQLWANIIWYFLFYFPLLLFSCFSRVRFVAAPSRETTLAAGPLLSSTISILRVFSFSVSFSLFLFTSHFSKGRFYHKTCAASPSRQSHLVHPNDTPFLFVLISLTTVCLVLYYTVSLVSISP